MTTLDSGLRIRVDAELRRRFVAACREQDITASQLLRSFMRKFVDQHGEPAQGDLFEVEKQQSGG